MSTQVTKWRTPNGSLYDTEAEADAAEIENAEQRAQRQMLQTFRLRAGKNPRAGSAVFRAMVQEGWQFIPPVA